MSLSAEEKASLREAARRHGFGESDYTRDQTIWLAAKNWAFEQAAKAAENCTSPRSDLGGVMAADAIRALKDQHG